MIAEETAEAGFQRGGACAYNTDISFSNTGCKDIETQPGFVQITTLKLSKVNRANNAGNDDSIR